MTEKRQIQLLISLIVVGLLVILSIIFYPQQVARKDVPQVSTYSLSPTQGISPTPEAEITEWKSYSNDTYHFSITVPEKWYIQDYAGATVNGGTLIAFSPDKLPCPTCTYFFNGYFSIKIYNQKTDPGFYALFKERMNASSKDKNYQAIALNKDKGVIASNTLALEHEGWIYEFSLDIDQGKKKISDSKVIQKVISSISFTNLFFSK